MRTCRTHLATAVALTALVIACSGADDERADDTRASTTTTATEPAGPPVDVDLEGPVTGGERDLPYNAMPADFESRYAYLEEEYFVAGTATAYTATAPLAADGAWSLEPGPTADYTTRIIVRQPEDPADFNGVVLVEWHNVTIGRDSDPDFGFLHPEILGAGYAYVGVSAQRVGVEGGEGRLDVPGVPPEATAPLKEWDPERYGALQHPGDEFSYDMFSQVGALVQGRAADTPLDGLDVDAVIALGESQSASRLVSYVNGVHPLVATFDGFFIHSRGGSGSPLGDGPNDSAPPGLLVRTDLAEPVLQFETETDLTFLDYLGARQPDSENVVTWEVAGTAHADQSTLDYGIASGSRWSDAGSRIDLSGLCGAVNTGPQSEVARAALERLRAWVQDGTPPPASPRIEADASGQLVRDADGIVRGGIRTPDVDAPVATLTGEGSAASVFCSLFGQEIPFSTERLAELYPSHDVYVDQVTRSADEALDAGFLLESDRDALVAAAMESDVGR